MNFYYLIADVPVPGLVPTEAEVTAAARAMTGEESGEGIHLGAFLTGAKKLIYDRKWVRIR